MILYSVEHYNGQFLHDNNCTNDNLYDEVDDTD